MERPRGRQDKAGALISLSLQTGVANRRADTAVESSYPLRT